MEHTVADKAWGVPPCIAAPVQKSISGRLYSCIVRDQVEFRDETNERTEFEPNIASHIPMSRARMRKAGIVPIRPPRGQGRSAKWWRAQCAFRGLAVSGTITALQDRIRDVVRPGMSDLMRYAYETSKSEYVQTNLEAIQEVWEAADDAGKLNIWPKRMLHEAFRQSSNSSTKVLVAPTNNIGDDLTEACQELGINCVLKPIAHPQEWQYLAILATDVEALNSRVAEIDQDKEHINLNVKQECEK